MTVQPSAAQGPTRVGKQTATTRRRREQPRLDRAETQRHCTCRDTDRFDRVTHRCGRGQDRSEHRVQVVREHGEPHPDMLSVRREPAKPPACCRDRHTRQHSHPSVPDPGRLRDQRRTDHTNRVTSTQQRVRADQHMRHRATGTSRASRTTPLLTATTTDVPPPPETPRPQPAATPRTTQLASRQGAFDFQLVSSYDQQQVPPGIRKGPPVTVK